VVRRRRGQGTAREGRESDSVARDGWQGR